MYEIYWAQPPNQIPLPILLGNLEVCVRNAPDKFRNLYLKYTAQ